jgi:organic hydroperoxide reductase OsmC/OhrA
MIFDGALGLPGHVLFDSSSVGPHAAGFGITSVHLDVTAKVPGATQQAFEAAASAAKSGCPVSKVLKAEITMDARLET